MVIDNAGSGDTGYFFVKDNGTVDGADRKDRIYGSSGDELLSGYRNDDYIEGGDGDDDLYGDEGEDILLYGGAGADQLYGGNDFDTYHADGGDTIVDADSLGKVFLGSTALPHAVRRQGETGWTDVNQKVCTLSNGTLQVSAPGMP